MSTPAYAQWVLDQSGPAGRRPLCLYADCPRRSTVANQSERAKSAASITGSVRAARTLASPCQCLPVSGPLRLQSAVHNININTLALIRLWRALWLHQMEYILRWMQSSWLLWYCCLRGGGGWENMCFWGNGDLFSRDQDGRQQGSSLRQSMCAWPG